MQSASSAPARRSAAGRSVQPARSAWRPSTAASQGSRTGPAKARPDAARLLATLSKVGHLAAWTAACCKTSFQRLLGGVFSIVPALSQPYRVGVMSAS